LVIGGGEVAERKVLSLLEAGARVQVISPQITERIHQLANEKAIVFIEREYRSGDLDKAFLVISATDNPAINAAIATEADRLNILLNVVDSPAECNFVVPASVIRGNLLISVSTSGKSPAFAKKIRQQIEQSYGLEYGPLLEILGYCRKFILEQVSDIEVRKQIFGQLAESILPEMIRNKDIPQILETIRRILKEKNFPHPKLEEEIHKAIFGPS
jgi:precorrin-2 dehydrogenase/sirohydrochlorin ferrochelatase